ncbi:MAG: DoxX-like family protein [Lacipirellulaceae bacterium]
MGIYVETRVRGEMAELWERTQNPQQHVQWDLRFTDIEYLPHSDESQPQRFLYGTRLGFGLSIRGEGETVGQRDAPSGERTSSLKFWSNDPKSLIREGAGYWQYVPDGEAIRFLTAYDYQVRFGIVGRVFDKVLFRPLMGWATAWSFDCLRLWIERGIQPVSSIQRSLVHLVARWALAFVWVYQGLVPKILSHHADELEMVRQGGFSDSAALAVAQTVGWLEVGFGAVLLLAFHRAWPLISTIVLMVVATVGVALNSPHFLHAAFNPVSLNVLMVALAVIGLLSMKDLPRANRCLRKKQEEAQ